MKQQHMLITDGYRGIFFPGAFTPNGDRVNDEFRPVICNLENFQWIIFNRVGQLAFDTRENNKGWDDCIKGQLQNTGVYLWTCSFTKHNRTEIKKGTLLLIR
ncbi:MAG: gliding motility-associated C-terminal domain-containing protein [Chitinophagaceae bacterium]